jgi:hypothetical protein
MKEKLRELYPDLTEEELEIAKENLDRYLLLAWDIVQESQRDSQADFDGREATP